MAVLWCYWTPCAFKRRDLASVAMPHNERGEPVAAYWLAWPPYIEAGIEDRVLRRRFKTANAAIDFADKSWPPLENSHT